MNSLPGTNNLLTVEQEELKIKTKIVQMICLVLAIGFTLLSMAFAMLNDHRFLPMVFAAGISFGMLVLSKKGQLKIPSYVIPVMMIVVEIYGVYVGKGLHDDFLPGFLIIIVLSGLLQGKKGIILFTFISIAVLLVLSIAELSGLIVNAGSSLTNMQTVAAQIVGPLTFASIVYVLIETLTRYADIVKKNAEDVKEREHYYRTLISTANQGISACDRNYRYTLWNAYMEKISGVPANEVLGKNAFEIFPFLEPQGLRKVFERVLFGETLSTDDLIYDVPDTGKKGYFVANFSAMRNSSGEITGLIAVISDITERKKIEKDVLITQKFEAIGLLAGGIAHDFNNILAAILGNVNLARSYDDITEMKHRLLSAEKAIFRAKNLAYQLLTYSKGGKPLKKRVEIKSFLEESVGFALAGTAVHCDFEFASDLPSVKMDENQMHQVIQNLVINARDAMKSEGRLIVSAYVRQLRERFSSNGLQIDKGSYLIIGIEDSGCGISEKNLLHIFDPYFTTKTTGHGLGLASCHSIIRNHHGLMEVTSKQGIGTLFNIYLPITDEEPGTAISEYAGITKGSGRVIVLDDDAAILDFYQLALTDLGYTAYLCTSSKEVMSLHQQFIPVCTILDITVHGDPGGQYACEEILRRYPDRYVVASSGYSENSVMTDFRAFGFSAILPKPFSLEEVSQLLHKACLKQDAVRV